MQKLMVLICVTTMFAAACNGCGDETPLRPDGGATDAGGNDRLVAPDAGVDAGVVDAAGSDAASLDSATSDAAAADSSAADSAGADGAEADASQSDAATAVDAGVTVEVTVSIRVDELGTNDVQDVRFSFVRLDWAAFQEPVVCEDGGYGDAGAADAGGWTPFGNYRSETVGETVVFNSVGRTAQDFTVVLPQSPPPEQVEPPPDDPCGLSQDVRVAYYMPIAFLDSATGTANVYDSSDDIIGMGEVVRYAGDSADGQPFLVYAEGTDVPFGGGEGWNYLVLGLGDLAPPPEVLDLATETFPLSVTVTPRDALDVIGELKDPDETPVTPASDRRVGLMVYRTLGGIDELASEPAAGTNFSLQLPAGLGGGDLSDYLYPLGPLSVARATLRAYRDLDGSESFGITDTEEGSSELSCPVKDIWYFDRPLGWPLVMYTRARVARGYNVLGRSWDPDTLQVTPFRNVPSRQAPIDIDIPPDPNVAFTDNSEPVADRGCACGLIPVPYRQGCN